MGESIRITPDSMLDAAERFLADARELAELAKSSPIFATLAANALDNARTMTALAQRGTA